MQHRKRARRAKVRKIREDGCAGFSHSSHRIEISCGTHNNYDSKCVCPCGVRWRPKVFKRLSRARIEIQERLRACVGAVRSDESTGGQQSHSSLRLGKPVTTAEMPTAKGTSQHNLQISQKENQQLPEIWVTNCEVIALCI